LHLRASCESMTPHALHHKPQGGCYALVCIYFVQNFARIQ